MQEDLYYSFDSLIGRIGVHYRNRPFTILRVEFTGRSSPDSENFDSLKNRDGNCIQDIFSAYFQKRKIHIDWNMFSIERATPLQKEVWEATAKIEFGRVVTYGQIARKIGKPGASRFVGNALGKNPFPVLVPCHRVIRSDGGLGGFSAGLKIKLKLLAFEGSLTDRMLAHCK